MPRIEHVRDLLVLSGLVVGGGLTHAQAVGSTHGPRDSTVITRFLEDSLFAFVDLNGDCQISDVDVALAVHVKMRSMYGEGLVVGDVDGDGVLTACDEYRAVESLLKASFGKLELAAPSGASVDAGDFQAVFAGVAAGNAAADINVDGLLNVADIQAVIGVLGQHTPDDYDLASVAYRLREYVFTVKVNGSASFMSQGCEPADHLIGVSDTWPSDRPNYWPPNHNSNVSWSWPPKRGAHQGFVTYEEPYHESAVSRSWPANHGAEISSGYPSDHSQGISREYWPPSHQASYSATWHPASEHSVEVSRTYWPNHTHDSSAHQEGPPPHVSALSSEWDDHEHYQDTSSSQWPPNHQVTVSQVWGPPAVHGTDRSFRYPPSHISYASRTWDAPENWPSNHTLNMSTEWGEPNSPGWPIFPPDHSWWATFSPLFPNINWPFPDVDPPSN